MWSATEMRSLEYLGCIAELVGVITCLSRLCRNRTHLRDWRSFENEYYAPLSVMAEVYLCECFDRHVEADSVL